MVEPHAVTTRSKWRNYKILAVVGVPVVCVIAIAVFVGLGAMRIFSVPNATMSPAIDPGDHFLMIGSPLMRKPHRGDVIVFQTDDIFPFRPRTLLVKRLVGLPGDRITLSGGILSINGREAMFRNRSGEIHYLTPSF